MKNSLIHENEFIALRMWITTAWQTKQTFACFAHSALTCLLLCRKNTCNGIPFLLALPPRNVPHRRCELLEIRTKLFNNLALCFNSRPPSHPIRVEFKFMHWNGFRGSKMVNESNETTTTIEWLVSAWWYLISNECNMINNYHKTHKLLYQIVLTIRTIQCLHSQSAMNSIRLVKSSWLMIDNGNY